MSSSARNRGFDDVDFPHFKDEARPIDRLKVTYDSREEQSVEERDRQRGKIPPEWQEIREG